MNVNQRFGFNNLQCVLVALSSTYLFTFLAGYLGKDPVLTAQDGLQVMQCRPCSLGWKPASPPLSINLFYSSPV